MAFLLPNISASILISPKSSKDREKPILHQSPALSSPYQTTTTKTSKSAAKLTNSSTSLSPPLQDSQIKPPPGAQDKQRHQKDEFYVNLGLAVRNLREDLPLLFTKDLNYDIYR